MKIDTRFTDTDQQGNINHTALVEWISHARVTFIDELIAQSGYDDLDHVLVHLSANFAKKVYHPSTVRVKSYVVGIGTKSVTTRFLLYVEDDRVAEAECVNVFFITYSMESVEIPFEMRDVLEGVLTG